MPTLPSTFQFNRNLKQEEFKDLDQVLQLQKLLKDLLQWSIDNRRFNLASHWAELVARCQRVCIKGIFFTDPMVITKGWNPNRKFRLLEERATRIRENPSTIQAIKEQMNQTGPIIIPQGSQGVKKPDSPNASHHPDSKLVTKSHHSSQSQGASRRRQGYKGKNKTTFSQRKRESDPMIQKLL
ncbi:hypothetical protein O181_027720 [Austropuccinia psidii MF-1]|uniref:Uncharacterized protein n=1 Tax=Austropuccinia psidii MF-1 TaxID=1389203 RepID=A0A9Q3H3H2_9BASI|nr:hypothetical protein [Austropuccinia psidii MF-1]